MKENTIKSMDDLLEMLDLQFRSPKQFWDPFYSDRQRPVPFFNEKPDENLVSYVETGRIRHGKALDLGCGPGRNSLYLSSQGFSVDAFDLSEVAIDWARERANARGLDIHFHCQSVFEINPQEEYDLIYDSGCMHHILPHRRIQYLDMVYNGLKPDGYFGLTCFAPGYGDVGGPQFDMSDRDVYEEKTTKGGLAFTEEKIRYLLEDRFECIELRKMKQMKDTDPVFGVSFLWTSLWKKKT